MEKLINPIFSAATKGDVAAGLLIVGFSLLTYGGSNIKHKQ